MTTMAKVYFLPVSENRRLEEFLEGAGLPDIAGKDRKIALKIHFGHSKHHNHIPAEMVRPAVEILQEKGSFPVLTDTNVLYRGERDNTFDHLKVAYLHNYQSLGIPILIAGGYRGEYEMTVDVSLKHFPRAFIAKELPEFDSLVALTHVKGHMLAGLGGTIKNLGMGCASRRGKFALHASICPDISLKLCVGCGVCIRNCPAKAISLKNKKAIISKELCLGCAQCIHVCPKHAPSIPWSATSSRDFQERLVEYAGGVLKLFPKRFLAINYLTNIAVNCDCCSDPGEIIARDIGILASSDPVAVDQASADLVKEAEGKRWGKGVDKFLKAWPQCDYRVQLEYAEKIGLGTRHYELIQKMVPGKCHSGG